jgi:hypothetical protein
MKNTLNNLFLAIFLALISQGIQAQFDDIYYDPDQTGTSREMKSQKEHYSRDKDNQSYSGQKEYAYDDENAEWDNQDYYYTSRIKRFHRPYWGFDYYNTCYVDNYFYDPFDFDPFFYNRDIYTSGYGYRDYYRWRTWHLNPWFSYSYWNQWDYCLGWSPYPVSFSYNYWPYSGCYTNYWGSSYYNYPYYGGNYNHWNNPDNHQGGTHFGSRRFGLTNSSNRGPVRIVSPSPRVFTEAHGNSVTPAPDRGAPKRIIRNADGDDYKPGPVFRPERQSRDRELPGTAPAPTDRQSDRSRYTPRELPGDKSAPTDAKPEPKREFRPERKERRTEENKSEFKPERIRRDDSRSERPRESYQQPGRESRPEPRIERRQESHENYRPRLESSGPRFENSGRSGDHRRSR